MTARDDAMEPAGLLDGILVADFSRVLAGPLLTMTLADLGARVVKVERPGSGDDTRSWGPPFSATGATYFESVNRNKESVTLDLRDEGDRALAIELARRADVVVENFKTGALDRLGLGYDDVRAANPGVVYCSITGFGSAGGAELPGYDFVVQALGGLMSVTGEEDGEPMKAGVALVDVLTAKDALVGILAALHRRERTGRGGLVEAALLSSAQAALVNQLQSVLGAIAPADDGTDASARRAPDGHRPEPDRAGSAHPSIVPYQLLGAADGPLAVAAGTDAQFRALASALGAPALADDPRFATNPQRVAHREALIPELERLLAARSAAAWEERLRAAGLAVSRVRTISEGVALAEEVGLDPVRAVRGAAGTGRQIASPVRIDGVARTASAAPPLLDEHGEAIRAWLCAPR